MEEEGLIILFFFFLHTKWYNKFIQINRGFIEMGIRRHKELYNASAAGSGSWIHLDSRYENQPLRPFQISMNASDTIAIQGTTLRAKDAVELDTLITSSDITTLETYTGSTDVNDVIVGSWTFIRAVKTGTNGTAKVQGFI